MESIRIPIAMVNMISISFTTFIQFVWSLPLYQAYNETSSNFSRATNRVRDLTANEAFRSLAPVDAGALHNKVVMQVHDRLGDLENSIPSGTLYAKIVMKEMLDLCGDEEACVRLTHQYMDESQRDLASRNLGTSDAVDIHSVFPDDVDQELKEFLINIYKTVENYDAESPVDDLLEKLKSISERATNSTTASDATKAAVQSVASIATGSTQLWMGIMEDKESIFHRILHTSSESSNRALQDIFGFEVFKILGTAVRLVLSDVFGAVKGALVPSVLYFVGVANPTHIAMGVTVVSLIDSLGAVGIVIPLFWEVLVCWVISPVFKCKFWSLQCSTLSLVLPNVR